MASLVPTACCCLVSPLSSDEAAQSLQVFLEKKILEEKMSFSQAIASVCATFPHCSSVVCHQQASGLVQSRIELDEPLCAVNDDMVLTTRGVLVAHGVYADEELVGLPHVRINEAANGLIVSPSQLSFFRSLPESIFLTHEIIYKNDDELLMQSKGVQHAYLCAVDTVVDAALMQRCDKVLADLEQQKVTNKKKTRTAWVLDVRFDKQIILYPDMGGQVHG